MIRSVPPKLVATSVPASEPRVKKRRCWPSGSKWAVEAGQREQDSLRAAVVGDGDEQAAAGAQHAARLEQQVAGVGGMLEHLRAPHEVDRRVLERDRPVGLQQPQVGARRDGAGALQRGLGDLHAHGVRPGVAQRGHEAPGAAAEVEHPLAAPRLAEQQRAAAADAQGSGSAGASTHWLS